MVDEHLNLHMWNQRDQHHANREQDLYISDTLSFLDTPSGVGRGIERGRGSKERGDDMKWDIGQENNAGGRSR